MKHNIYEFRLKILCFVSKGSLNIPEYRRLLIGRVQYLYTIEHAVENIALCNSLMVKLKLIPRKIKL